MGTEAEKATYAAGFKAALRAAAQVDLGFVYLSGGYWRKRGVPKGVSADMFHGEEIVEEYRRIITNLEAP